MAKLRVAFALLFAQSSISCGADEPAVAGDGPWVPPPERCDAPNFDDLSTFAECSTGSGSFGRFTRDARSLPGYDYHLDQHADPRAAYTTTERDDEGEPVLRRDHWSAFGNRRVNAWLTNDGVVEVATQDRGVEILNKIDPSQSAWGGGIGWLSDGSETWCTAFAWRPSGARTSRRFGMGYGETSLDHRGIAVRRVTASPPGLAPVVITDVSITNTTTEPRTLSHWEYWDVARRPIEINWLVSGSSIPLAPQIARETRDERNALFTETARFDAIESLLFVERDWAGPGARTPRETPSAVDHWPNQPFLVSLLDAPADVFVDQAAFFGDGDVAAPGAVVHRTAGAGTKGGVLATGSGAGQPLTFVMRHDLSLAPGETKTLRFAYGYARSGEQPAIAPEWRGPAYDAAAEYAQALAPKLVHFAAEGEPVLSRELSWHAYQIETSVGWRDYWQGAVVPQGSAYLYLHGADGAARDLGLFAVPLVYTDPDLAKAELRLFMGVQHESGRFSYAFQGHGMLDDAGIHTAPSDLPLFFLWAMGEYLGATGDLGFLDEHAPYHPRPARPDARTWSHLVDALRHQFDVVGTGEHGLIRIQTGDWSDGIVVEAPDRALAVEKGESIPNTQMAVAVLPRIADLIEARDAPLAQEIRQRVLGYRAALSTQFNGEFFPRAYFGDGKPAYAKTINLEAQIWALIGGTFANETERATLIANIAKQLDDPSATGATLLPGGQVWPAISAPLTWGYALSDPERAFAHFRKNTLAAHALAFPDVWYGIWSGPDGTNSSDGLTWKSQVTPMTDFPVQNNNAHAMPILAALRLMGIDASATGLTVRLPPLGRRLSIATALVDLDAGTSDVRLRYRATGKRARTVVVHAPAGTTIASATQNGQAVAVPAAATSVSVTQNFTALPELDLAIELGQP